MHTCLVVWSFSNIQIGPKSPIMSVVLMETLSVDFGYFAEKFKTLFCKFKPHYNFLPS